MKKITLLKKITLSALLLCSYMGFAQLHVSNGTQLSTGSVGSEFVLYSDYDVDNKGTMTFVGDAQFYLDSGLDNGSGIIEFNDATFHIGSGDATRSAGTDVLIFNDRDANFIGDRAKFVVLNKVSGTANVTAGHLGILETFQIENGTLNADDPTQGIVTLLNRSATDAAQVIASSSSADPLREAKVEVERFMSQKRAFRFYASTVNSTESIREQLQENATAWDDQTIPGFGTHITGVNPDINLNGDGGDGTTVVDDTFQGLDWQPSGNASLFLWKEQDQFWSSTSSDGWSKPNTTGTLNAKTPYRLMVRGDRTITITDNDTPPTETKLRSRGTLLVGNQSVDNLATPEDDFSFVANPYASRVDYTNVSRSNLTDFIYVWDVSVNGRGGYVTVDLNDLGTPDPIDANANHILMPGQSFFVQNTPVGNPSITFSEAAKTNTDPVTEIFSITNYFNFRLEATDENNHVIDGIGFRFSDLYSEAADEYDGAKLTNSDVNLAILNANTFLSIDKRPTPVGEKIVPLALIGHQHQNYQFVPTMNLDGLELDIFLRDNYLDQMTAVEPNEVISFNVDQSLPGSVSPYRFEIVFNPTTLSQDNFDEGVFSMYPNPAESTVSISLPKTADMSDWDVKLFSINGQLLNQWNYKDINQPISLNVEHLESGIYLIELSNNEEKSTQKLIKK